MALTKRQKEILDFLKTFIEDNGYAPSFEEICSAFGYTSARHTVHEHLTNLGSEGVHPEGIPESRSIEFPPEAEPAVPLPLLGTVAAGQRIEAVEDSETLAIPGEMIRQGVGPLCAPRLGGVDDRRADPRRRPYRGQRPPDRR